VVNSFIIMLTDMVNQKQLGRRKSLISKFMSIEPEKRERVINAALKEFAQKGYKNASTNQIVEEANISKGLLFHYFSNKKGLYFFLYDYSSEVVLTDFYGKMDFEQTDIIERWTQIAFLKLEIIKKHPDMYRFMLSTVLEDSAEVRPELESRIKNQLDENYKRISVGFDTSKFKEGVDIKLASDIIIWTIQGFGDREIERLKLNKSSQLDYDKIVSEFQNYIQQLKKCFYK
jgi:TetR/AcrR family transcriptional regulator